jgi:DNA repair protein RecO (recombination protein O)
LSDQLGNFNGELIHPAAAVVLDDALALGMLTAACAVAAGALPERETHPQVFDGLLHLLARLPLGATQIPSLIRWEAALLADLGYGMDLTRCAVTGATDNLVWVSPKSGCAVSDEGAGLWKSRLFPLPAFLRGEGEGDLAQWADGLRITGHFLKRDAFGHMHKPLPAARAALYDRVATMSESAAKAAMEN